MGSAIAAEVLWARGTEEKTTQCTMSVSGHWLLLTLKQCGGQSCFCCPALLTHANGCVKPQKGDQKEIELWVPVAKMAAWMSCTSHPTLSHPCHTRCACGSPGLSAFLLPWGTASRRPQLPPAPVAPSSQAARWAKHRPAHGPTKPVISEHFWKQDAFTKTLSNNQTNQRAS